LNIPEADLKDLGSDLLQGGQGVLFQNLKITWIYQEKKY